MTTKTNVEQQAGSLTPISARDIEAGTYFFGDIGGCKGMFVRSYDRVVLLHRPRSCWHLDAQVHDFQRIKQVNITTDRE